MIDIPRTVALALVAAGFTACDDFESAPPFDPIGRPTDAAPPPIDTDTEAPAESLKLRFVPIEHDAGALRITDMVFLPGDGGFLVVDKDGEIIHMRLVGERAERLGGFATGDTWSHSDAGLISVAVDPAFERNGFIYVGLTTSRQVNVIRRYVFRPEIDGYDDIASTAVDIFTTDEPRAPRSWHNIGKMGFDDVGALWVLFGDKVIDDNAADPHSPLGSLVRIVPRDADFEVPEDNPFADGNGHPAVYAKGFRSPWTGFFHDGRWWVGDIGLDGYEEVNVIDGPAQDFGWPDLEGPCRDACGDSIAPWLSYGRSSGHPFIIDDPDATSSRLRSVWVAAPVSPALPDRYRGLWNDVMLFGDAFVGYVRGRHIDGGESFPVGHLHFATDFAQAPDGFVYASALGTWPVDAPVMPSPILRVELDD